MNASCKVRFEVCFEVSCEICGCESPMLDEVLDAQGPLTAARTGAARVAAAQPRRLLLAECPRCDHRWTHAVETSMADSTSAFARAASLEHAPLPNAA